MDKVQEGPGLFMAASECDDDRHIRVLFVRRGVLNSRSIFSLTTGSSFIPRIYWISLLILDQLLDFDWIGFRDFLTLWTSSVDHLLILERLLLRPTIIAAPRPLLQPSLIEMFFFADGRYLKNMQIGLDTKA
jgi:hypothetical protein